MTRRQAAPHNSARSAFMATEGAEEVAEQENLGKERKAGGLGCVCESPFPLVPGSVQHHGCLTNTPHTKERRQRPNEKKSRTDIEVGH